MAVDTRDRRFSLLAFGKPVPQVFANPDGSVDDADRFQFLYLYAGIVLEGGVVEAGSKNYLLRRRRAGR